MDDALRLVEAAAADGGITAAVPDVDLGGAPITPVADALAALGVPFLCATGYSADHLQGRPDGTHVLEKPFDRVALLRSVLTLSAMGRNATPLS